MLGNTLTTLFDNSGNVFLSMYNISFLWLMV